MQYILMALFAAGIVVADQLTKQWVVANIPLHTQIGGLDGIFCLTYTQNTGAAFSSFEGMRWLFVLIFAVFAVGIIWEFSKKRMPFSTFERWCIVAVFGGGLGNIIDRLRLGYVVDMIDLEFWPLKNFPVFNVADCFITGGCIVLLLSLVFFNKEFWKDEKKK